MVTDPLGFTQILGVPADQWAFIQAGGVVMVSSVSAALVYLLGGGFTRW